MNRSNEKKHLTANIFSTFYDEIEDRIRITVNYNSYESRSDLVLTRSLVIQFLPVLNKYIQKYYKEYLEDTVKNSFDDISSDLQNLHSNNNKKQKLNFTNETDLNFLKKEDELLTQIQMHYNIKTKSTTLQLHSRKTLAKAILDESSFIRTVNSIKYVIPVYKWGLSPGFIEF